MEKMDRKFYSVNEVAEIIGCVTTATLYLQIKQGNIPAINIGARHLIPAYWVKKLLQAAEDPSEPKK